MIMMSFMVMKMKELIDADVDEEVRKIEIMRAWTASEEAFQLQPESYVLPVCPSGKAFHFPRH